MISIGTDMGLKDWLNKPVVTIKMPQAAKPKKPTKPTAVTVVLHDGEKVPNLRQNVSASVPAKEDLL